MPSRIWGARSTGTPGASPEPIRAAIVAAVLASVTTFASAARAADADFYRGKQLSLVVNYTAGGPTDTEARLIARHLSRHIPGNPPVTVRNMAGAAGVIGINWMGQVAAPDGLTLSYMTGIAGLSAHASPTLKVDATTMPFIAGIEGITVYYARADVGGGLSTPADIMTKSNFWIGGLTPDSDKDLRLRCELDLLGLRYRYISGYTGAAEARLALEQNEIQMTAETLPTYRMSIEPALVKTGKAIPLWYDTTKQASLTADPDAVDMNAMPYQYFYRQAKGAPPPDNDLWRMCELLNEVGARFTRTINMPPKSPEPAVAILRQAFAELARDDEFINDAIATIRFKPRFTMGPDVEAAFRAILHPPRAIQEYTLDYIEKGKSLVGK